MKTLRVVLIISIVILNAYFLYGYTQAVYGLYEPPLGSISLGAPQICVYRPWSSDAHGGVSLFLANDPPEGTRSVFRFPTWPLALVSSGSLIYAAFMLFGTRKNFPA